MLKLTNWVHKFLDNMLDTVLFTLLSVSCVYAEERFLVSAEENNVFSNMIFPVENLPHGGSRGRSAEWYKQFKVR